MIKIPIKSKEYEFYCSECDSIKKKIISKQDIKEFKKWFGYDIKKEGSMALPMTCKECSDRLVKGKKCKKCGKQLKNYLDVFCSEECHETFLKERNIVL